MEAEWESFQKAMKEETHVSQGPGVRGWGSMLVESFYVLRFNSLVHRQNGGWMVFQIVPARFERGDTCKSGLLGVRD